MASMCRCTHIELAQSTIFTPSGISSTTITVDDTLTVGASTPLSTLTLPATETVRSTIDSISFTAAPTPIATVTSTTVVKATCQKESAVMQKTWSTGSRKVAERLVNTKVITGKKAQGGQNVVIIDCGAAGVYEY